MHKRSPKADRPERYREEREEYRRSPRDGARRPKRDEAVPGQGKRAGAEVLFRKPLGGDLNADAAATSF